jgi:hypothetical protein
LNMLMVQTQVIWPMKLSTPTRPPASGTNGAARRGPSSRASARVMKPAAKRSRKSPRRRARKR